MSLIEQQISMLTWLVLRAMVRPDALPLDGLGISQAVSLPDGTIHPILAHLEACGLLESSLTSTNPSKEAWAVGRHYSLSADGAKQTRKSVASASRPWTPVSDVRGRRTRARVHARANDFIVVDALEAALQVAYRLADLYTSVAREPGFSGDPDREGRHARILNDHVRRALLEIPSRSSTDPDTKRAYAVEWLSARQFGVDSFRDAGTEISTTLTEPLVPPSAAPLVETLAKIIGSIFGASYIKRMLSKSKEYDIIHQREAAIDRVIRAMSPRYAVLEYMKNSGYVYESTDGTLPGDLNRLIRALQDASRFHSGTRRRIERREYFKPSRGLRATVSLGVRVLPARYRGRYKMEFMAELCELPRWRRHRYLWRVLTRMYDLRRVLTVRDHRTSLSPDR